MYIRQYGNISKSLLRKITGVVDYYELAEEEAVERKDEEFHSILDETDKPTLQEIIQRLIDEAKSEKSNHVDIDEIVEKAMNESEALYIHKDTDEPNYTIKHHRLSRTQILQMLLYHFFSIDERGLIRDVSEKEMAKILKCNIRTIRNNHKVLEEIGLIYYSHSGNGVNIQIRDYEATYLSREQGGSGYFPIPFSRFEEFVNVENVNALRIELRQEMAHDNKKGIDKKYNKKSSPARISLKDVKNFLPKYTHYRAKIKEFLNSGTSAFKSDIKGYYIVFELNEGVITGKELKEQLQSKYKKVFSDMLNEVGAKELLDPTVIDDFIQLSFEYTVERVAPIVEELLHQEFIEGTSFIRNWGGHVRTLLRREMTLEKEQASVEKIA